MKLNELKKLRIIHKHINDHELLIWFGDSYELNW